MAVQWICNRGKHWWWLSEPVFVEVVNGFTFAEDGSSIIKRRFEKGWQLELHEGRDDGSGSLLVAFGFFLYDGTSWGWRWVVAVAKGGEMLGLWWWRLQCSGGGVVKEDKGYGGSWGYGMMVRMRWIWRLKHVVHHGQHESLIHPRSRLPMKSTSINLWYFSIPKNSLLWMSAFQVFFCSTPVAFRSRLFHIFYFLYCHCIYFWKSLMSIAAIALCFLHVWSHHFIFFTFDFCSYLYCIVDICS